MAPKQCPGKEVATFATAAPPPPVIERPIAGRVFPFSETINLFRSQFWLFYGEFIVIHQNPMILGSQTPSNSIRGFIPF